MSIKKFSNTFVRLFFILFFTLFFSVNSLEANTLDFISGKSAKAPVDILKDTQNSEDKQNLEKKQKKENLQNSEQKQSAEKFLEAENKQKQNVQKPGFLESNWLKLKAAYYSMQLKIYKQISEVLTEVKSGTSSKAFWSLILISFLYGIFHTAGPGHGKALIATYLTTQNTKLKNALILAFFMAQAQAISAIVLVYLVFALVSNLSQTMNKTIENMYLVSAIILTFLAIWLIYSSLKGFLDFFRSKRQSVFSQKLAENKAQQTTSNCENDKNHKQQGINPTQKCTHNLHNHKKATGAYVEKTTDFLQSDCSCNHSVDLSSDEWNKSNLFQQFLIIASVGLRPCTGAIMILSFSKALNIWQTGVIATFAMSLGVGISMFFLAIISVYFRDFARKMLKSNTNSLNFFISILKVLGAILILVFAALLYTDTSATSISRIIG